MELDCCEFLFYLILKDILKKSFCVILTMYARDIIVCVIMRMRANTLTLKLLCNDNYKTKCRLTYPTPGFYWEFIVKKTPWLYWTRPRTRTKDFRICTTLANRPPEVVTNYKLSIKNHIAGDRPLIYYNAAEWAAKNYQPSRRRVWMLLNDIVSNAISW